MYYAAARPSTCYVSYCVLFVETSVKCFRHLHSNVLEWVKASSIIARLCAPTLPLLHIFVFLRKTLYNDLPWVETRCASCLYNSEVGVNTKIFSFSGWHNLKKLQPSRGSHGI